MLASSEKSLPLISVVIPTYNRAALVVRAVRSVIAAVQVEDEIIVVDDGSTDETVNWLQQFSDRIQLVSVSHGGAGAARNFGVRIAKNRWVAFLDSDDEWDPDKIQLQRPLLKHFDNVAFIFSDFRVQSPEDGIESRYTRHWSGDQRPWDQILGPPCRYSDVARLPTARADFNIHRASFYRDLMFRSYVSTFTYLFRKDLGATVPTFATDLPTLEDWQFFAQVAKHGDGLYMDCETATQHGHGGPRLSGVPELDWVNSRLAVLRRVWGADTAFLQTEAEAFSLICRKLEQRGEFLRGCELALDGRLIEARARMREAGPIPWKHRIMYQLPDPVIRAVMFVFGFLRTGLRRGAPM